MNKTNFKLFTMFLAGIAFSALTVFAATISISTNFEDGAIQYLKKLVILMDNNNTWIILDWSNSKIMSNNICDKDWNNCKIVSQLITGSALNSYLTWTRSFLTWENTKWCIMSAGKISCFENAPSGIGGDSVWMTGASKIYYNSGNVGIGTDEPTEKFQVSSYAQIGDDSSSDTGWNFLRIHSTYVPGLLIQWQRIPAYYKNPNIQLNRKWQFQWDNRNRKIENNGTLKFDYATGSYDYDTKLSLSSAGIMTLDGNIKLETGGYIRSASNTNQLYLDYNGRVGIGTNNPSAKLQVNGNVKFSSIGEGTWEFIIQDDPNGTDAMRVDMLNKRLIFDSNNDWYNVGIWTASPSSKLEVVWNTKISGDLNIKNNSLYVGGTNSYVGIGTNTPSSKLDVEWTWSFDDLLVSWKINTNKVSALKFQWNNESDYMKFSTMMWGTTRMWNLSINNKDLISAMFDPNDNTNMFIIWEWWISSSFGILKDDWNPAILVDWSNEYNVWIWNDSPYQKLDVSGAIKIWYPATNTWCDINTVWTIQYKNITDGWALSVCVRTKWTPGATYQWINIVVATWWNINSMISLDSWILVWWPL